MRLFFILVMMSLLLMVWAANAQERTQPSRPDGARPSDERAFLDSPEMDRATGFVIPCDWDGWRYARMPRYCWNCQAYADTWRNECRDGWVTRIEKVRVCVACEGGK